MGFFETSRIISFHRFRSAREGRISIQPDGNYVGDVIRGSTFCKNENLRSAPLRILFLDLGTTCKNINVHYVSPENCLAVISERNFDIGVENAFIRKKRITG